MHWAKPAQPVQLIRPLDFLVITDHAEMMGLAPAIRESNPILPFLRNGGDVHVGELGVGDGRDRPIDTSDAGGAQSDFFDGTDAQPA